MARKKKQRSKSLPCFAFTPEMVSLTQKALSVFERYLRRTDARHPNLAFAEETVKQVKEKLGALHSPIGPLSLAAFDYNETIVVATAIQLHALDLNLLPATSQRARELQQCQEIAAYFSLSMLNHHNFI